MKTRFIAGWFAAVLSIDASAQSDVEATELSQPKTIDEIVVTGEYPGPGLWKVTKQTDDSKHVLWIFGTLSPMPNALKWRSQQVEEAVAESQEIVAPATMSLSVDDIGVFKAITLIPAVLRARKNPDDKKLHDLVPVDVYAHWLELKAKYLGRDAGIESWRPTFAVDKLENEAYEQLKVNRSFGLPPSIRQIAAQRKIKVTSPSVWFKIPAKQVRAALKEFSKVPLADIDCFTATLAVIEALGDHKAMNLRANAWARGDLSTLRDLPPLPNAKVPCEAALVQSQVMQSFHFDGLDHLEETQQQRWMEAIETAIGTNRSTFALLPIDELLKPEGRMHLLREKGYQVEEPT